VVPNEDVAKRSYAPIEEGDLRVAEFAAKDRQGFFFRCPRYLPYTDRVVCVALCQGAALHYVDHKNGVKDIDVCTFTPVIPKSDIRGHGPWRMRTLVRQNLVEAHTTRAIEDAVLT
jgi:hypothetical protein